MAARLRNPQVVFCINTYIHEVPFQAKQMTCFYSLESISVEKFECFLTTIPKDKISTGVLFLLVYCPSLVLLLRVEQMNCFIPETWIIQYVHSLQQTQFWKHAGQFKFNQVHRFKQIPLPLYFNCYSCSAAFINIYFIAGPVL